LDASLTPPVDIKHTTERLSIFLLGGRMVLVTKVIGSGGTSMTVPEPIWESTMSPDLARGLWHTDFRIVELPSDDDSIGD
jgi:hypothetical protein